MPLIKYENINFSDWKLGLIHHALSILTEYAEQGYTMTLRQVYYQFVARDLFPERWVDPKTGSTNNIHSYNNLKNLIGEARMAGLVDWKAIVDRTRERDGNNHWTNPTAIIKAVSEQYMIDKWEGQAYRPEVWVEKDAVEGVVEPVCRRLDIPFFSCRGYTSMTSIWDNAQHLKELAKKGIVPVIIHLGDHDPSGIDMSRDIEERVRLFMDRYGSKLKFVRVALNMDQVELYNPPENPAKSTDSRFKGYKDLFGESSWELDALEPTVIDQLISAEVAKYRNDVKFNARKKTETTDKELLVKTSDRWEDVTEFLSD